MEFQPLKAGAVRTRCFSPVSVGYPTQRAGFKGLKGSNSNGKIIFKINALFY
jgi:hypothetical protein